MKRLLLALFLTGCPAEVGPPKPPAPIENEGQFCAGADQKLREMGCDEATTPLGRSFKDVCIERMEIGVNLHPKCIIDRVTRCEDIDPMCSWGTK